MDEIVSLLQGHPGVLTTIAVLMGLVVGSFLNVVIHRLPRMMEREWKAQAADVLVESKLEDCAKKLQAGSSGPQRYDLILPPSSCPSCGHRIRAIENVPIVSYLLLRGRCANCKTRISPRYPVIESVSGMLAGLAVWHFGFALAALAVMLFAWALLALTVIDIDTQLLPDDITLPLLWMGLLLNIRGTFATLPESVIGAVAGYLSLWSVYWLFKLVTGKEGMGFGDFKLLSAIGAWLGWKMLPLVILLSSFVGAFVGIVLIAFGSRSRNTPIPFGPYLAAAGLIAVLWGEHINTSYLRLFQ